MYMKFGLYDRKPYLKWVMKLESGNMLSSIKTT